MVGKLHSMHLTPPTQILLHKYLFRSGHSSLTDDGHGTVAWGIRPRGFYATSPNPVVELAVAPEHPEYSDGKLHVAGEQCVMAPRVRRAARPARGIVRPLKRVQRQDDDQHGV